MTSEEFYKKFIEEYNMMQDSSRHSEFLLKERMVELIQQAKSEWLQEYQDNILNEFAKVKNYPYCTPKIIEIIKNAPEP